MKLIRYPGLLAYAAMIMWLLQLMITRVDAAEFGRTRLADHIAEITSALVEKGVPQNARVTLAAPDATIGVAEGAPLVFDSVSVNPATGRFLIRARSAQGAALVAIAGTAIAPIPLPVLTRNFSRNEEIRETDIDWLEVFEPNAGAFVADADAIIGKSARRPLAAGAPLRNTDLQSPVLIRRGETAMIVVDAPGLRLTQSGVALSNGGAGDVIAFRNVNSALEFKATVDAKGVAKAPIRNSASLAALDQ